MFTMRISWFSSAPSTKTPTKRMSRVLSTTSPSLYGWRYEEFLYRAILVMKFPSWVGKVRFITLGEKMGRDLAGCATSVLDLSYRCTSCPT